MIAMRRKGELGGTVYEPTPKDIRRACEQLQATWSPQERAKRYRGPCAAWWIPPTIRLSGLFEAVNEEGADSLPYFGAGANETER
jgi:hypothetical protein